MLRRAVGKKVSARLRCVGCDHSGNVVFIVKGEQRALIVLGVSDVAKAEKLV